MKVGKEEFLRQVNKAYADGNMEFLMDHIIDDLCWIIVGEKDIAGKEEFREVIQQMKEMPSMEIEVENVIINDSYGIVEGVVISRNRIGQKKHFGFCDIYGLQENGEQLMINSIKSYVIDISRHLRYKEQK